MEGMEALVKAKPNYEGGGGLTAKMRRKLTSAAHSAIKMRSTQPDRKEEVKLLERDILNSPHHCFGIHSNCSSEYCKVAAGKTSDGACTCETDEEEEIDDVVRYG